MGHRKAVPTSSTYKNVYSTKTQYKQAKNAYNKAYNKAYGYTQAHPIGQFTNKKKKAESDRRWNDVIGKANTLDKAKSNYKYAKTVRKNQIKSTYRNMQKNTTFKERLVYNDATRKRAAKYVVDNNMSVKDATNRANKDAMRNTAMFMAAYGTVAAASLYKMKH